MKTINIKELWYMDLNIENDYPFNEVVEIHGVRAFGSDKPVVIRMDLSIFVSCVRIVKRKIDAIQIRADSRTQKFKDATE